MRDSELLARFEHAVAETEARYNAELDRLADSHTDQALRSWLNGEDAALQWEDPTGVVTPDEWFFITTLYGTMSLAGQRSHIRRFFPTLFVAAAHRDIRNFVPNMPEYTGLRQSWMPLRLTRMGGILRENELSMAEYVDFLRLLERDAGPDNPMPALDKLMHDHRAGEGKTLAVFVRDCVAGNSFPIDSRVRGELTRWGLPESERVLVSFSLAIGRNPRLVARMFYERGGQP